MEVEEERPRFARKITTGDTISVTLEKIKNQSLKPPLVYSAILT